MGKIYLTLVFIFICQILVAQVNLKIIQITDCSTKLALPFEEIRVNGQYQFTNEKGIISLTTDLEKLKIGFDRIGNSFDTLISVLEGINNICINKSYNLDTIVINDYQKLFTREQNAIIFGQELIRNSSYLLGEKDIIKTIQYLPGVVQGQEGSVQYFVRGGGSGENQVLIDDVPLALTGHAFGVISNIDPSIVQKAKFYKGGFPAEYGNRLSSYLDIRTIDPSTLDKRKIEYNIGTLTSSLLYMQPLGKKFSFIASIRSSPLSLLKEGFDSTINALERRNNPSESATFFRLNYYFWDTYQKLSFTPHKKVQISLSHFNAEDLIFNSEKTKESPNFEIGRLSEWRINNRWRNQFFALNGSISPSIKTNIRFYANTNTQRFGYDSFQLLETFASRIEEDYENDMKTYRSGIKINHFVNNNLSIFGGVEYEINNYKNDFYYRSPFRTDNEIFTEANKFFSSYIMVKGKFLTDKIYINSGLRMVNDQFTSIEPRFNIDYEINSRLKLNASASRTSQRNHLLTRETVGIPYMIWLPTSENNPPSTSDQVSLGSSFEKSNLSLSLDLFMKKSKNLVLPALGQDIYVVNPDRDLINAGENFAKGVEFQAFYKNEKIGSFNLNYTLSRSFIKFPILQDNVYFHSYADRPNSLNLNYNYKLNEKWNFSATWIYLSGNVMTVPDVVYPTLGTNNYQFRQFGFSSVVKDDVTILNLYTPEIGKFLQYDAEAINNYRVRSHHRLDLSATKTMYKNEKESRLTFGIYNAYLRKNPFISFLVTSPKTSKIPNLGIKSLSLYNFIPFISYSNSF